MVFLQYGKVKPFGELRRRLDLSIQRMTEELYKAENITLNSQAHNAGWPGDWEGRTLLAQIMLAKVTGLKVRDPFDFLSVTDKYLNSDGYWGERINSKAVNEQQLAGNSWYLRALCELYEWQPREEIKCRIEKIVKNLVLATNGLYETYPITRESRQLGHGHEGGELTGETSGGWLPSTDIGCVFIMVDGASHAYHLLRDDKLYTVLSAMIRRFLKADLLGTTFQTHATLSALRGMLRFYGDTGEKWLIEEAARLFDLYTKEGMSENYANFNWFRRPEWTEPCAIVDSYLAAMELWRYTGQPGYLETAQMILFNALYFAQRHNGGFGCDVCVGAHEKTIHPNGENAYEAWWCCTMRGADGLSNAATHMAATKGNTLYLPVYHTGSFVTDLASIRETTNYPYAGEVDLEIAESSSLLQRICLFCPSCVKTYQVSVDGKRISGNRDSCFISIPGPFAIGQKIILSMDIPLYTLKAFTKGFPEAVTLRYGMLELAANAKKGEIKNLDIAQLSKLGDARFKMLDGTVLQPLTGNTFATYEQILNTPWQILFSIA